MNTSYEKVRDKIMEQIGKSGSEEMRAIMMMMLSVLEHSVQAAERIEQKLDALLRDEDALRASVLNGHAETHHEDHDYMKELRAFRKERKAIDQWAMGKIKAEEAATETTKTLRQKFAEAIVAQAGTLVAALLAGVMGIGYLLK